MDFDQIIPLIVIMVIWVVSNAIRNISKADQEKPASADQKPGLLKILLQNLAALEEKGNEGKVLDINDHFQPATQPRSEGHEKESIIEIAEVHQQQESTISIEMAPISPPTGLTKPLPSTIQKKSMALVSRRKLQNAVIWAEILAPPLAMRNLYRGRTKPTD